MITGDELAFVRLAMRKRILTANLVREAVERKKWDTPNRSLPSILVDMGALDPGSAARLRRAMKAGGSERSDKKHHNTVVGRDRLAREHPDEVADDDGLKTPKKLGKYKVIKLLGAGAMGAVYHAQDMELHRDVALKLLLKEGAAPSPRAIQRFKREARLAARLDHPNIVRVYEAGEDEGYHYIAMEMVTGRSVAELIALGEMSPRRAVHITRKTAEAIGYAHERDVIHRDLKPANILVDEAGEARVTDFGLAVLSEGGEDDRLTRTGAAVGTPAYMAPEQVRGQLDKIDGRTDIYAVGATLYEMLTGHPPFEAPTFLELAKKICDVDASSPRKKNAEVPNDVATICLKALEKDKAARYQKGQDMADDLTAFIEDKTITAQAPSALQRVTRWGRRRPALVAGFSGFLAVLLGGAGYYLTLPGTLEIKISSAPGDVILKVDDVERGTIPARGSLKLELPAGRHKLRFFHPDHLELAPGADTVMIRHGLATPITTTLVSKKGALRVGTDPPGAQVTVLRDSSVVHTATSPFFEQFLAGTYTVRISKPGYHDPEGQTVEVGTGGVQTKVDVTLTPDPAGVHIEADQDDVVLRRQGDPVAHVAPVKLPGARQDVTASKAGYLPRALRVQTGPGEEIRRRVSLTPLASYRVPLMGTVVGEPLVRDVDADGAQDLLVLEEGPTGTHLALLPGGGHLQARFRAPTSAKRLVGAIDINGDAILDVLLGNDEVLMVLDGRNGQPLTSLPLDTRSVAIATRSTPPSLVYATRKGLSRVALDTNLGQVRPPAQDNSVRTPPALLEVHAQGMLTTLAVVARVRSGKGGLEVWSSEEGVRKPFHSLAGIDGMSRVSVIQTGRGRGDLPWVVAIPRRGPAYVVDPLAGSAPLYLVGEKDDRFGFARGVLPTRGPAWLLLGDERTQSTRIFMLSKHEATEVEVPLGPDVVVLHDRDGPLLWSRTGACFRLEGKAWVPDAARSADASPWTAHRFTPTVADLDGDGLTEVLAPGPDRRSLVALAPRAEWLRWRSPAKPGPRGPFASLRLAGEPMLALGLSEGVLGLAIGDGREAFPRIPTPARVEHLAAVCAEEKPPVIYAAGRGLEGGKPFLIRAEWDGEAWQETWGALERTVSGVVPLPLDLDNDGHGELLVGGPLALLHSKSGSERWNDKTNHSAEVEDWAPPYVVGSKKDELQCLGASAPRQGREAAVVAYDPIGKLSWKTPLVAKVGPTTQADPPERLLAHPELRRLVFVITQHRLLALQLTDGQVEWELKEELWRGPVGGIGAAIAGGSRPTLVLTRYTAATGHEVVALDAARGSLLWARKLPAGLAGAKASEPVILRRGPSSEEAVALVTPSGVVLFLSLADGTYLGERRHPETFLPWLLPLRVDPPDPTQQDPLVATAPDTLLVAARDDHVVALRLDDLGRRPPGRRELLREQIRRIELGGAFLDQAIAALPQLANPGSPFAARAGLALAEAQMAKKNPSGALDALKRVLELAPEHPDALELRVRASFEQNKGYSALVRDHLVALAKVDARLAAQVAVDLSQRSEDEEQVRSFLNLATYLAPQHSPRAHRELGFFRLSQDLASRLEDIEKKSRGWKSPKRKDVLEVMESIKEVRGDLSSALASEDDIEARAAALLVTVLEYRITARVLAEGKGRDKILGRLHSQLTGLQSTGRLKGAAVPPLLRLARRLAEGCSVENGAAEAQAREWTSKLRRALNDREDPEHARRGWSSLLDAIDLLWTAG